MEEKVREVLTRFFLKFLEILNEEGKVEVRDDADGIYVNLRAAFRSLPAEDNEFREALARLASRHLKISLRQVHSLEVDINGQQELRRKKLVSRALSLAERVRVEKKDIKLEPMPPKDRRLIHLTLANFPGVRTYSVGKGAERRVVIAPQEEKPSGP